MIYIVTDTATSAEVYRYQSDTPVEWSGIEFATHTHTECAEPVAEQAAPAKFAGRRLLTKLEFRSLFPESAIKSIDRFEVQFEQAGFLTDDQKDSIRTAFNDYHEASDVNLDDPRWIPGLGLYVALGMMTTAEVSEVLRG